MKNMSTSFVSFYKLANRSTWNYLISSLVALVLFQLTIGLTRIRFENIDWLTKGAWGDSWQHYLGWATYRNSPWEIPIGANSDYGLGIGNSVVFTDSIPIFSVLFKILSVVLPETFQFFGLFLLFNYVMQAIIATKIAERFSRNKIELFSSVILMCAQPILWHRVNTHIALTSHWLILWFIYIYLSRPQKRIASWSFALFWALGTHFYFFIMGLCIFLFEEISILHKNKMQNVLKNLFVVCSISSFSMWQFGYFVIRLKDSATKFGFELQRMDLMQPLNFPGWSLALGHFGRNPQGNFDGFNYLGLGSILGLSIAIALSFKHQNFLRTRLISNKPLLLAICLMACYSITNHVSIARHTIVIPMPEMVELFSDILRGAGRFFWPAVYLICLLQMLVIGRLREKTASLLLVLICVVQIVDTYPGWSKIKIAASSTFSKDIVDISKGSWKEVLQGRTKLLCIPYESELPNWEILGFVAAANKIPTNCIRAARVNGDNLVREKTRLELDILRGSLESASIYVIPTHLQATVLRKYPSNQIGYYNNMMILVPESLTLKPREVEN